MPGSEKTTQASDIRANVQPGLFDETFRFTATMDMSAGAYGFEWTRVGTGEVIAKGRLFPTQPELSKIRALEFIYDCGGGERRDGCTDAPDSTRALVKRIRNLLPLAETTPRLGVLTDVDLGEARAGDWYPLKLPPKEAAWKLLERAVQGFAQLTVAGFTRSTDPIAIGRTIIHHQTCELLDLPPLPPGASKVGAPKGVFDLRVTFDQIRALAEFTWTEPDSKKIVAVGSIRCPGPNKLTFEVEQAGNRNSVVTSHERASIHAALGDWLKRFPTSAASFTVCWIKPHPRTGEPVQTQNPPFAPDQPAYLWLEDNIIAMAAALALQSREIDGLMKEFVPEAFVDFERYERRLTRKEQKRTEELARQRDTMARLSKERRQRELRETETRKAANGKKAPEARSNIKTPSPLPPPQIKERPPLPELPVHFEMPPVEFQETAFPLADLRAFFLRERAALWWVSNQSDDLLCLPHCRVERLEYQIRTALRVLGPLRGRALLSDEVGLGKTIEAGLVIKELLTRGMVKRFLVLTVPSLVDQWEEELSDKFGLSTVTSNAAAARGNPQQFWRDNPGIVASLHTLKQPAHLEIARQVHWDILVVDEAHHLRNRQSLAWQAVNGLPRQFLLLLTATPVQNSLEELYNLVTLLQPGQLPTPKEFRARFFDPKRPRQPREPEELRRLLGQVMIRNTRANSGVKLPPRRAETVLFEPDEAEGAFWRKWESELRVHLAQLNASQSSLWGRLLLQTAGSSPAAWRSALEKFPCAEAARAWREQSLIETSWQRKIQLIPPLTHGDGGAVIFTQFLETQAALAGFLSGTGVATFVINGSTPAPDRQPLTEEFRKNGGALLLTHSGTEGRNLQFCHRLVNFDLPWNPMEIEQRIGRLHRLGQQHPVRIYNFVQAGSLQEHLLQILQEKLNLFELVVGETGLVLGERFDSDEFASEVFRRWHESEGRVAEALAGLGDELAAARDAYGEVKKLDETLFSQDYESL